MSIAISKAVVVQNQFSPNLEAGYWVPSSFSLVNAQSDATLVVNGYYDQAGYDQSKQPLGRCVLTVPNATYLTLTSDELIGAYLLTLPQFAGGTAQEAA